jgi:hypothetical protein
MYFFKIQIKVGKDRELILKEIEEGDIPRRDSVHSPSV